MKRTEDLNVKDINGLWKHVERANADFEKTEKAERAAAKKHWVAERARLAKMGSAQFNAELKSVNAKRDATEKLVGEKGVILGGEPAPLAAGTKPTDNQINALFAYKYTVEEGLEFAKNWTNSIERFYGEPTVTIMGRVKA
ncbi:MAG: hypothetical protein LBI17_02610 [Rickettsiales bacterium]|jgi:hypothetical protein|nr:hypothetical protein [Rickettsiales bacterium]